MWEATQLQLRRPITFTQYRILDVAENKGGGSLRFLYAAYSPRERLRIDSSNKNGN